ncbi:unnamed protein product [Wickerhamomyces anomalus]
MSATTEHEPTVDSQELNGNVSDNEESKDASTSEEVKPVVAAPPPSINDESAFPALGGSAGSASGSNVIWGPSMKTPSSASSSDKVFSRSSSSRVQKSVQEAFNIKNNVSLNVSTVEFRKIISELKKTYDVSLESTVSTINKDRTFVVSGSIKNIPSRTRAAVIGSGGKNLRPIIESTGTRINIERNVTPGPQSSQSDEDEEIEVTIDGDIDGVTDARKLILAIVDEETKHLSTRVQVPDELIKFVKPFDINEENLKVSGPNKNGSISIQGLRDDVLIKKNEIVSQLNDLKIKIKTETKSIPKKVHQFIKPDEIYKQFNVVIEIPKGEIDDEELVSFVGLPSDINAAIQHARNTTSQFIIDSLDISRAHGGNVDHARALAAYFSHAGLLNKIGEEFNTIISAPPFDKLVSRNLKNVSIDISAPKTSTQSIKDSRKKIVELVNGLAPTRIRFVNDVVPFFAKRVASITESSSKSQNVHVVPLSFLAENKTNEIILVALDNEDDEFAPSQEEINARLDVVDHSLDELRKAQSELKSVVLDVEHDKQQFIEGPNGTTLKTLLNSFNDGASAIVLKLHYNGDLPSPDKVYIQDLKDIYSFKSEIHVPKNVLPRLIGKNGGHLNTLRDQFGVNIDVEKDPQGEKAALTITGYKFNVKEAEHDILQSSKRWADEVTKTVIVPQKYHGSIIGQGGQYVKRLQDKYNVRINFTQGVDDVVIRGPSRGAIKAEEEVKELVDYFIENGYTKEIKVPTKALSRIIGKNGETMNGIAADAGVEIDVKDNDDKESEFGTVLLTGSRKGLKEAETKILAIVKEFQDTITVELEVDPKYFRDILGARGSTKTAIIEKAGGADLDQQRRLLQIPDQSSESKIITSSGPKKVVESIIEQVKKIVQEKENSVTEKLDISKDKHRLIIGTGGTVRLKLLLLVYLKMLKKLKLQFLELTADDWKTVVEVPAYLHAAVAERGAFTRKIRSDHNVEVTHGNSSNRAYKLSSSHIPTPPSSASGSDEETFKFTTEDADSSADDDSDLIPWRLKGEDEDVAKVESLIKARIEQFKKDNTSGFLWYKDPSVFGRIVGIQGSRLNNIRKKSGAQIYIPRKDDTANDVIYLKGTKAALEKAEKLLRAEIEKSSKA